jgi:hypothetical protein
MTQGVLRSGGVMAINPKKDFEDALNFKRGGGVPLEAHVSSCVWMGGILDAWEHEPFVALGPKDWDSGTELTYFSSRDQIRELVAHLEAAADKAWPK